MGNVFQFGSYAIGNDCLFGWHFQFNNDGHWMSLQCVGNDLLEAVNAHQYPAYVPDSFKEAVKVELKARADAVAAGIELPAGGEIPAELKNEPSPLLMVNSRPADFIAAVTQLLDVAPVGTVFELPYLRLEVTAGAWLLTATRGDGTTESISRKHHTIHDVINRILARWW